MASIQNPNENEQNSPVFGQQQSNSSSSFVPSQSSPQQKGSGRFMNLQKYVQANQPQAQQMAGRIGGNIAQKAEQSQQSAEDIRARFNKNVESEQGRLGQANQYVNQLGTATGAQSILQSPEELQKFQQIRQGQLNVSPENLSKQQDDLRKLQEQAQLAGTEAGRFQLLRQQFGSPSYSLGQRKLDQLLLQSAPGAVQQIQGQINPSLSNLKQTIGRTEQDIQSKMSALRSLAGEQQSALNQALTSGVSGIETELEQARQEALSNRSNAIKQFQDNLINRSLTSDQLQELGAQFRTPYSSLFGVNVGEFVRPESQLSDISVNQIASPEQAARYRALQQLGDIAGKYGNLQPSGIPIDNIDIDNERLRQEIMNRQEAFSNKFNPEVEGYKTLQSNVSNLLGSDLINRLGAFTTNPSDSTNYEFVLRDALNKSGLDQNIARQLLADQITYMSQRKDPNVGIFDPSQRQAMDSGEQNLRTLLQNQLNQRQQSLRQLAEKEGALDMVADYTRPGEFGSKTSEISREDNDQFRQLLDMYMNGQVRALNEPMITGSAGKY